MYGKVQFLDNPSKISDYYGQMWSPSFSWKQLKDVVTFSSRSYREAIYWSGMGMLLCGWSSLSPFPFRGIGLFSSYKIPVDFKFWRQVRVHCLVSLSHLVQHPPSVEHRPASSNYWKAPLADYWSLSLPSNRLRPSVWNCICQEPHEFSVLLQQLLWLVVLTLCHSGYCSVIVSLHKCSLIKILKSPPISRLPTV